MDDEKAVEADLPSSFEKMTLNDQTVLVNENNFEQEERLAQRIDSSEKKINTEEYPTRTKHNEDEEGILKRNASCDNESLLNEMKSYTLTDSKRTGIVYDKRMCDYYCYDSCSHVERPARITVIYHRLKETGLLNKCALINSRLATEEEILLKHTKTHFDKIQSVQNMSVKELNDLSELYDSIYFHEQVTVCSMLSAGCTFAIVEAVLQGRIKNGTAIVRPPGHHALSHSSMGFCHFNNVAIAAMLAIEKYGLKKILIVDWDIHYGNGIHKMFEDDPRVLYFSLHRYDHKKFWPSLSEGNYDTVGVGAGEGFNIHIAWNESKQGDSEYICAFDHILVPVCSEYQPELILVSCGFDSGLGDPLGRCCVTPKGYANMTHRLMQFANGNVVLVLEGGYNLTTLADSMEACVKTLLGFPPPPIEISKPSKSGLHSVSNTLHYIKKYWSSLTTIDDMFVKDQSESKTLAGERFENLSPSSQYSSDSSSLSSPLLRSLSSSSSSSDSDLVG